MIRIFYSLGVLVVAAAPGLASHAAGGRPQLAASTERPAAVQCAPFDWANATYRHPKEGSNRRSIVRPNTKHVGAPEKSVGVSDDVGHVMVDPPRVKIRLASAGGKGALVIPDAYYNPYLSLLVLDEQAFLYLDGPSATADGETFVGGSESCGFAMFRVVGPRPSGEVKRDVVIFFIPRTPDATYDLYFKEGVNVKAPAPDPAKPWPELRGLTRGMAVAVRNITYNDDRVEVPEVTILTVDPERKRSSIDDTHPNLPTAQAWADRMVSDMNYMRWQGVWPKELPATKPKVGN